MSTHETAKISTDRTASVVAEGVHLVQFVDYEQRSGAAGPYWAFQMEIIKGPFEGKMLWSNISLSNNARWKLEELLDACDVPPGQEVGGDDFLSKVCKVEVKHDQYEGRTKANVSKFLPAQMKDIPEPTEEEEEEEDAEHAANLGADTEESNSPTSVPPTKKRKKPF
jgi:hypothetical protein